MGDPSRGHGRSWVLVPILALILSSCASTERTAPPEPAPATSPEPPAPTPSPQPTGEPTEEALAEVPAELRFTAPAVGGGTIDGADYAGRDLVIWFWAPW